MSQLRVLQRESHRTLCSVALAVACSVLFPATLAAQVALDSGTDNDSEPLRPGTVAVVPFVNISGQPSDAWIGSGISETVTADLQRVGTLSVIGREALLEQARKQGNDVSANGDDGEPVARELGKALGVAWLVSGGYQRLGDRLRITARVIDVATGAVSTTVKVDGGVEEIFALQDRIVVELGDGFELFAGERSAALRSARRGPGMAGRGGNGEGNNGGASRPAPGSGRPAREGPGGGTFRDAPGASGLGREATGGRRAAGPVPAAPAVARTGPTPDDVTGGITLGGNDEPQFGVATGAGILTGRPTVRPPRIRTRPDIDGRLDDAVWRSAVRITDFVQLNPVEGALPTEATDVYIAYDSQNLYFGIHAHYSDPSTMRANRIDRDRAYRDDTVAVYFDTFVDQQRAYKFSVNGYGVQGDSIIDATGMGRFSGGGGGSSHSGGGGGGYSGGGGGGGGGGSSSRGIPWGDWSWDALFDSGGQIVDDGFTAEMAIPFKSLRYPQKEGDTPHRWGFQIVREIRGKDEVVVWASVSRSIAGFLPQMGLLDGVTNLSTSRNLEILPTFTATQFGSLDRSTGEFENRDTQPEGGLNLKYGITSNLTADVTFNPDFSQIESDRPQIEVNQRFALFYPELRPFFLEGAEIFRMSGPVTVVHTRTIVDPRFGGKITGKVGKTTLGLLVANDEAAGSLDDASDPRFDKSANVVVGRVRYDLYSESHIGAIFTDRELLDSYSRLGGVDGNFRLGQTHALGFRAMQTEHRDLDGVDRSGQMFDVNVRRTGRNLSYSVSGFTLSPDFRTDVGFVRRVDQRRIDGNVSYRWWPESWIINWGPSFNYGRNWNFDDVLEDENTSVGLSMSFAKNINFFGSINRDLERFRGVDFQKSGYSLGGSANTSRKYSFGGFVNFGDQVFFGSTPFLGKGSSASVFMTLRPVSRFQSEIRVATSRLNDPRSHDNLVFDVKIYRALTTYQFTDRLLFRNIAEYNTFARTVGFNLLFTYRVNAGTVFYVGYDDHYQQAELIDDELFPDDLAMKRTNRAFFTKLRYLFRY